MKDAALEILRKLMTNPHICLGDMVYLVRDREGKGWDGEAVKSWGEAVLEAEKILKTTGETK